MKILIIEDEADLLSSLSAYLIREHYMCEMAEDFMEAIDKIVMYEYDIILLDITLPGGNGLELINTIKKHNHGAGIIIISAKNSLNDKITGLDLGADDYLTKPFQLSELNSRIKALLRRRKYEGSNILEFQEISINTDSKTVTVMGHELSLTRKEYDLLLFFIINQNRVLTKDAIAEHLWNDSIELADNFDFIYTHLNNVRKKIRAAGGKNYIRTLYGMGYKFSDQ